MACRDGHESVAAPGRDRALTGHQQRVVRSGERDAVDQDQVE
jgi:hypothetical protein